MFVPNLTGGLLFRPERVMYEGHGPTEEKVFCIDGWLFALLGKTVFDTRVLGVKSVLEASVIEDVFGVVCVGVSRIIAGLSR